MGPRLVTLPATNKSPLKIDGLEDDPFLWRFRPIFKGELLVWGKEVVSNTNLYAIWDGHLEGVPWPHVLGT